VTRNNNKKVKEDKEERLHTRFSEQNWISRQQALKARSLPQLGQLAVSDFDGSERKSWRRGWKEMAEKNMNNNKKNKNMYKNRLDQRHPIWKGSGPKTTDGIEKRKKGIETKKQKRKKKKKMKIKIQKKTFYLVERKGFGRVN